MADRFARAFGSFLRRIVDMGDGTYSERVVATPPADMVVDGKLQVDAEMAFPPDMVTGDRLKVNLDEPIDVTLPAALISSNRLKVQVDSPNPLPVSLSDLLITGGGIGGVSPRIRVDPGQTGFFAGKMFRAFFNGIIPKAGPAVQFRFTSPIDFVLWTQELELTQGSLQLEVYTGATPSGTWTPLTPIGVNRMAQRPTPYYAAQVTIDTSVGGTGNFTGGTRVDLLQVRTSSTNGTASNVGNQFSERGLPAGVYYGRLQTLAGGLTVNDDAQYKYSLAWEERP